MATEIKAIQCPKCGSTQKTEVRPGDYRCDSCGTEYFLDNDNTRATIGRIPARPTVPVMPYRVSPLVIFVLIILSGIIFILFTYIFGNASSSSSNFAATPSGASERAPTWQYVDTYTYVSADNRPMIVGLGTLTTHKSSGEHMELYVFFVDAAKDSMLKSFPMPGLTYNSSNVFHLQEFSNGDLYIEANNTMIYKVNKASYSLKDVTQTLGSDQPELVSGIAKIEFISSSYEDGFRLVTNDGKQLYYFPVIGKVYKEKDFWKARSGMNTLLPGAVGATGFGFSAPGSNTGEDTIQLVKYRFMDNRGGPRKMASFWSETDKNPPLYGEKDADRVLSFANFTPGRLYFTPKVLYHDSDYVLISFAPTASNTIRYVQCMNARTAAIVFTVRLDDSNLQEGSIRYKDGFVLHYIQAYVISMKGKLTTIKNDNYGL